ncbi:diguanylate cyclase domain-containing protein [Vibrio sp. HN007]|uniref:diguanylate cyclase domain-containing protein n=1 Tax=Vibrio iocasae TaxID=3098914 RepID=UPI0035D4DA98
MKISISRILLYLFLGFFVSSLCVLFIIEKQRKINQRALSLNEHSAALRSTAINLNLIIAEFDTSKDEIPHFKWNKSINSVSSLYNQLLKIADKERFLNSHRFELDIRRINQQFEHFKTSKSSVDRYWTTINLITYTQNFVTHLDHIINELQVESRNELSTLHNAYYLLLGPIFLINLGMLSVLYQSVVTPLTSIVVQLKAFNSGRTDQTIDKPKIDEWNLLAEEIEQLNYKLHQTMVSKKDLLSEVRLRQEAENKALQLAQIDELTELPNRRHFQQLLKEKMRGENNGFYLIFLDLDSFKDVNDTLGHSIGDEVLTSISRALVETLCTRNSISRIGGDEFAIVIDVSSDEEAFEFANRMRALISEPLNIGGAQLRIECSIGIAKYPEHGRDIKELLASADSAMYYAKRNPALTSHVKLFNQVLREISHDRFHLSHAIKKAIVEEQFDVWFQPQIKVESTSLL